MAKEIASGVWPVMITPFTEDNRIDYNGVLQIIEWYDRAGVDGIFAVCQSSEMQELMNFLGAASTIECQVYPVNSKYHMQLEGLNITTKSRRQDDALLTGSRRLEIDQFHANTQTFRKYFFGTK